MEEEDVSLPEECFFFQGKEGAKRLVPHYWDGERWSPVKTPRQVVCDPLGGLKRTQEEYNAGSVVGLVTYNVWFGKFHVEERMKALGELISSLQPEFVALQEVNPHINELLLSQPWTHEYYVSDPLGKELNGYGVMLLSKLPFHELIVQDFPTRLGRRALLGTVLLPSSSSLQAPTQRALVLGTFHLESYKPDVEWRRQQVGMLHDLTKDCPRVLLCGDTNFASDREAVGFGPRFKDAWHTLHPNDPGVTVGEANSFMGQPTQKPADEPQPTSNKGFWVSLKETVFPPPKQPVFNRRLDRVVYTHATIEPCSAQVIGKEPFVEGVWPSDHYGLHTMMKMV
ncbi:Endo/exonuclease/phosphatase domain-containing protein [Balamuthia mandrillaris]